MTRSRACFTALPIGMLLVGPFITGLSFIVRWPLGLTSSQAFTHHLDLMFAMGMVIGLVGGLGCVATRCQPGASGLLVGGGMLITIGALAAVMAVRGSLARVDYTVPAEVLICSLSGALTAYLTAVLARIGERRRSGPLQPPPPSLPPVPPYRS